MHLHYYPCISESARFGKVPAPKEADSAVGSGSKFGNGPRTDLFTVKSWDALRSSHPLKLHSGDTQCVIMVVPNPRIGELWWQFRFASRQISIASSQLNVFFTRVVIGSFARPANQMPRLESWGLTWLEVRKTMQKGFRYTVLAGPLSNDLRSSCRWMAWILMVPTDLRKPEKTSDWVSCCCWCYGLLRPWESSIEGNWYQDQLL